MHTLVLTTIYSFIHSKDMVWATKLTSLGWHQRTAWHIASHPVIIMLDAAYYWQALVDCWQHLAMIYMPSRNYS